MVGDTRPAYKELIGLVSELVEASARLESTLAPKTASAMAGLVIGMNCYYSNLIEGHHTLPLDIDQALKASSKNLDQRKLPTLAAAHIEADKWAKAHILTAASIPEFIRGVHGEFCAHLPNEFLLLSDGSLMEKGEFRTREVEVGIHVAPLADSLPLLMNRCAEVYGRSLEWSGKGGIHRLTAVLASFAAHHRLVWIHPFMDGNGRVSRIVLDAMLRQCGLNRSGLWSMSRGFAKTDRLYKSSLAGADQARQGHLDGRGHLSESKLVDFCRYSIETATDQALFMTRLFSLDQIKSRIDGYFQRVRFDLKPEAARIYHYVFLRGSVERGEAGSVSGLPERTARDVLASLIQEEFLLSDTPKGKLRVGFPLHAVGSLFPNLYPAGDVDLPVPRKNQAGSSADHLKRVMDDNH